MGKLVRAKLETAAKPGYMVDVEKYFVPDEVMDIEDELSQMQDKCAEMLGNIKQAIRAQKGAIQAHKVALKDAEKRGQPNDYKVALDLRIRELKSMENMQVSLKEILSAVKNRKA